MPVLGRLKHVLEGLVIGDLARKAEFGILKWMWRSEKCLFTGQFALELCVCQAAGVVLVEKECTVQE